MKVHKRSKGRYVRVAVCCTPAATLLTDGDDYTCGNCRRIMEGGHADTKREFDKRLRCALIRRLHAGEPRGPQG